MLYALQKPHFGHIQIEQSQWQRHFRNLYNIFGIRNTQSITNTDSYKICPHAIQLKMFSLHDATQTQSALTRLCVAKKRSQNLFSVDILTTSISICINCFRLFGSLWFGHQCQQAGSQLRLIRMPVHSRGPYLYSLAFEDKIKPDMEKSFWDPVLVPSRTLEKQCQLKKTLRMGCYSSIISGGKAH